MFKRKEKYLVNNYVPTKVTETNKDLDLKLKDITYKEILNDLNYYFKNCYITNFDLIHNECRGDKLDLTEKFIKLFFLLMLRKN